MKENSITAQKTARYFTTGEINDSINEVWFVLHGYGQLSSDFLMNFDLLDDGTRLIVAPEGLSRFYIKNGTGQIGASWMTREDRLNEIEDYIDYLTKVNTEIFSGIKKRNVKRNLLGFSQGTATATRWFEKSNIKFDNLILWGGHLAADSNLHYRGYLETPVCLVYGAEDKFLLPTYFEDDISILKKYNVSYRLYSYKGGHIIDPDTLLKLTHEI